jgi:hypothetical protein
VHSPLPNGWTWRQAAGRIDFYPRGLLTVTISAPALVSPESLGGRFELFAVVQQTLETEKGADASHVRLCGLRRAFRGVE